MADATERLLLQVDASVELLRRHMAEGEAPLDRFEKRAAKMADNVDRSLAGMGKGFRPFADLAETAAQRAEKSFESSFSQIQRIAATAIKGPTVDGRIDIGVDGLRAGAAAAQEQARAYGLITEAARATSIAERDTTEATRLFIQAGDAARIEAERKAAALLQEAGALERVQIELLKSADAVDLFVGKHQRLDAAAAQERQLAVASAEAATQQRALAASAALLRGEIDPMYVAQQRFDAELARADDLLRAGAITTREYAQAQQVARDTLYAHAQAVTGTVPAIDELGNAHLRGAKGAGAQRAAMAGLSFQLQDTFTQLSMGANFFQVIAIQGGQAAGQFANVEGKAGAFARFLIGPYGLAITAALLIMGPLAAKIAEVGDETDKAVDKLKKDAVETEINRKAKERFKFTAEGVSQAIRDQAVALDATIKAGQSAAEQDNINAKNEVVRVLRIRETTAALLARAKAEYSASQSIINQSGGAAQYVYANRLADIETAAKKAETDLIAARQAVQASRIPLAQEAAERAIDPLARIKKKYDDLARAARISAEAETKRGKDVTTSLTATLAAIERNRAAENKAEEDRKSAAHSGNTANRQSGREINVTQARAIVASIGGRVTSGTRSRADQERIYADKLAGRHAGPVAKPGTSDHERGQAVDIAYGPGITIAKIREAFAKQGVAIRQLLDEPAQRVFHVAFGKKGSAGPSQSTIERKTEAARQQVLRDDTAYTDDERAARHKLLEATRKTATSEEQRDGLLREDINAEADATRKKIANDLSAGDINAAQGIQLSQLNEATRAQRLQNVKIAAANRVIDRKFDAEQDDLQARLAVLRINQDLAVTDADRRRIGRQILDAEQELRRSVLRRVAATSQDPVEVSKAQGQLQNLPTIEAAENKQLDRSTAGPIEQYRDRLKAATSDTNAALQDIAVQGFGSLEDAGSRATGQAVTDLLHLKGVAGDVIGGVISDLARLAIQKAIVSAIGTGFLGFSGGGTPSDLPGYAEGGTPGGLIQGPGTGTSDSILAVLGGGKGAIRVSTKEFIVNAAATQKHLPLLHAINSGRLPGFASGGMIEPSVPRFNLREPRLDMGRYSRNSRDRLDVSAKVKVEASPLLLATVEQTSARTVGAAAEPIMAGATSRTMRRLAREPLPGGFE